MNSAQRRKHRRKWRYAISFWDVAPDWDYSKMDLMDKWCRQQYGCKGYFISYQDSFHFDKPEKLTHFLLRWSGA